MNQYIDKFISSVEFGFDQVWGPEVNACKGNKVGKRTEDIEICAFVPKKKNDSGLIRAPPLPVNIIFNPKSGINGTTVTVYCHNPEKMREFVHFTLIMNKQRGKKMFLPNDPKKMSRRGQREN